ncbi:hypothetical protein PFISCL1PPCAC_26509, partial [Pristionchus fissidentatus]
RLSRTRAMSDEENGSEYEEEVEEEIEEEELEAEEVEQEEEQKEEREPEFKTGPLADNSDAKIQEYEEKRRLEREKEEDELRLLKEKQEKRKAEREEEERLLAERLKEQEERRRVEEEERKAKYDAEKKKREDEKKKREEMMQSLTGKSFIIPPKAEKGDKFGNIVQAKQEMGLTKDQKDAAKRAFLKIMQTQLGSPEGLSDAEVKAKIKEMHSRIAKLEADKYDLEKRHERQEYDLKELNERSRQVARNAALKKGIDPADAGNSRHPAKKQIMSKYDRQIDRRNFNERRMMYETRTAYPVFPGLPPPPTLYEKIIKGHKTEEEENDGYGDEVEVEVRD